MLMTKSEAVHKICPSITYPIDTHSGAHASCCCAADECMAWRWAKTRGQVEGAFTTKELPPEQWTGYCGLAGKPAL